MLTLSRKVHESVVLTTASGEVIRVVLTRAHNGRAKVGIEAPQTVKVLRAELKERAA